MNHQGTEYSSQRGIKRGLNAQGLISTETDSQPRVHMTRKRTDKFTRTWKGLIYSRLKFGNKITFCFELFKNSSD